MMNLRKNAFTLVEVLISILLLGIIFTYLYSTIDSLKLQNMHYLKKSESIEQEKKLFSMINFDVAEASSVSVSRSGRYDILRLKTKNSLYGIIEPNVMYFVSKKENALIRVESLDGFDMNSKEQITEMFLYGDIVLSECESFKASDKDVGFVSLLLRGSDIKPMLLKIPTIEK